MNTIHRRTELSLSLVWSISKLYTFSVTTWLILCVPINGVRILTPIVARTVLRTTRIGATAIDIVHTSNISVLFHALLVVTLLQLLFERFSFLVILPVTMFESVSTISMPQSSFMDFFNVIGSRGESRVHIPNLFCSLQSCFDIFCSKMINRTVKIVHSLLKTKLNWVHFPFL